MSQQVKPVGRCCREQVNSTVRVLFVCPVYKFRTFFPMANVFRFNPFIKTAQQRIIIAIGWLVHWPLMGDLLHLVQRGGA